MLPLLAATLFGVRWMAQSSLPDRFLIGPFALGVCVISVLCSDFSRWKLVPAIMVMAGFYCVYWPLREASQRALDTFISPPSNAAVDSPFGEPLNLMGCGARILFVGNQYAPDYPLFRPRDHYCNTVISWGKAQFDPTLLEERIRKDTINYVLVENDIAVGLHWDPPIMTQPMVQWLAGQPRIRSLPLATPHMRLFMTQETAAPPVDITELVKLDKAPDSDPLVFVDQALHGQVGVDRQFIQTPWAIEDPGHTNRGFLWLGAGPARGLQFALWAKNYTSAEVRFDVGGGISRTGDHSVTFLSDAGGSPQVQHIQARGWAAFGAKLRPGRNVMQFWTDDQANVSMEVTHDSRDLMIALNQVIITSGAGK
jgi:hypothetical protein